MTDIKSEVERSERDEKVIDFALIEDQPET